ncbi:hypothetical protein [Microcoleus sp. EPA2]|uniref:hypothetical protein n=1 Tax=Microcoleus sp. EPA2 TaxID=2841654 RepID=UPI00312BAE87
MTISLKTIMENLPPEPRAIVEKRSVELMAEEMTLKHLGIGTYRTSILSGS